MTLIEAGRELGGNCQGVAVHGPDGERHVVDLGVSDFNARTFLTLKTLLEELGASCHPITQDASFSLPDGTLLWFFRDGRAHFEVALGDERRFLAEMARFRDEACEVLEDERFARWTLGRYAAHRRYSSELWSLYLAPRAIGCFPTPDGAPEDIPIRPLVAFWRMHGLVGSEPGLRMVVDGGMHTYVRRFEAHFVARGGRLLTSTAVTSVRRHPNGVVIHARTAAGAPVELHADDVIFATPPGAARRMLADRTPTEDAVLGRVGYQRALVYAHRDTALMPRERDAWCAYNYVVPSGGAPRVRPTITFYPNRLARLPQEVPDVFVSMNPHRPPHPNGVLTVKLLEHPMFDARTEITRDLGGLQGRANTWFAGSYVEEPFVHEQALASGFAAAAEILGRQGVGEPLDGRDRPRPRSARRPALAPATAS